MTSSETGTGLVWGHSALELVLDVPADGPVAVRTLSGRGTRHPGRAAQPLVELLVAGAGRARASHRFSDTSLGRRLVHTGDARSRFGPWHELRVDQRDERIGLTAETTFRSADGVGACQVITRVTNGGTEPVLLLGVTSFAAGFGGHLVDDLDLVAADSEWLGEGRWTRRPLRDRVPDLDLRSHGQHGRGRVAVVSTGAWSTGTHLPTGGLVDRVGGQTWLWQVEHNGPWRWEVGERLDGAYVALLGPTDVDHQWRRPLAPGESFTTVPVSVAVSHDGLDGATAELTRHRRALVRPHGDHTALPVVFNDYMNTLMGDPTTARLLPLVDAAAAVGAEVFCIDAGWYDDDASWWDSVGEWQPSQTRFPRGIEEVLIRIRDHGMVPGLWLEPEVVGVRSPMADKLPEEAFLRRGGVRVVEHDRYHLDLRHPAAVAHLDEVVDRLVEQLGVGYFKLDYNIDPGVGTDVDADSAGDGLLGHNRAHQAWLDRLLDRHPDLVLENCASGAMRMDYALLSRMQLQSTSDQQDPLRYPPIAVAAPLSVLPEQSASWAYPQPGMSAEEGAFTLVTGMLGRLYLSGHLDRMDAGQLDAVRDAVQVHQDIRADLARAVPVWPLGLPGWDDPWLSLGLRTGDVTYLAVWRRTGTTTPVTLPLSHLRGRQVEVEVLYPRRLPAWTRAWSADTGALTVTPTDREPAAARLFRITATDLLP
ncbi:MULTISPECIES: glycoside hydrolase family 36 protein [Saccharothrix]|uniref:glycoside hydrolase family 36 protein n=1 Tax=Saccharothrix TaxID=2071 RepID=UPI000938B2FB|nr:glycoside hydrolase family 36 protein [Saccharothrix sp. CB00851]OKI35485.1 alpha-galactosidase [Saccharothrix sp. CB00851]